MYGGWSVTLSKPQSPRTKPAAGDPAGLISIFQVFFFRRTSFPVWMTFKSDVNDDVNFLFRLVLSVRLEHLRSYLSFRQRQTKLVSQEMKVA